MHFYTKWNIPRLISLLRLFTPEEAAQKEASVPSISSFCWQTSPWHNQLLFHSLYQFRGDGSALSESLTWQWGKSREVSLLMRKAFLTKPLRIIVILETWAWGQEMFYTPYSGVGTIELGWLAILPWWWVWCIWWPYEDIIWAESFVLSTTAIVSL